MNPQRSAYTLSCFSDSTLPLIIHSRGAYVVGNVEMKFMKLGSRPDTFYTTEAVRSVLSEVSSDLIVQVKGSRYLLHKFPLVSKCLHLQRLCTECPKSSQQQIVQLPDFPGGDKAFELCAKFCYGITITLSAYNIVMTRCAAEYLQMTEDVEQGNLVKKVEVFFNSCILRGWKDTIITLKNTKAFPVLSEDLGITSRCIEAIASQVLACTSNVISSDEHSRNKSKAKGWWGEDVAELGVDLYWRTIIAIKSGGKVPSALIGDALRIYASQWLKNISKFINTERESESDSFNKVTSKHRQLLETIVSLLPAEKGAVSCSFLLKLLKAANIITASSSSKMELVRKVGRQLDEAKVSDLLVPTLTHTNGLKYDVDFVITILEQFLIQGQSPTTSSTTNQGVENFGSQLEDYSASLSSKRKVAKLVDGYLQEIAPDENLPFRKFIAIAETIPDCARLEHDDLYKAIDIYLKGHPELSKSEKKRLCRILDCKKLSLETCLHAAENEMLPLRVVVQVLFFSMVPNRPKTVRAEQIN